MPIQNSEILDRLPPQSMEAEQGVVGSMLLDSTACDDVANEVSAEDFYDSRNSTLYRNLMQMHDAGRKVDATLLLEKLKAAKDLDKVGGVAYLAEVATAVPYASNAAHYAQIVHQKAIKRAIIHANTEALRDAYDDSKDASEVLEGIESNLAAISLGRGDSDPVSLADAADGAIKYVIKAQSGQGHGVFTGLEDFDRDQGGLFPGELIVLAARPGVGKTSFALQIANHNASRGRPVYFASLEMSAVELSMRMACGAAGVSNRLVRTGGLSVPQSERLGTFLADQEDSKLYVHDKSRLTIAAIRREIRQRKKEGLCLAIVDYLQLITPSDSKVPREQQVATMVRSLKETAREYEIPILCLAQLNRQIEQGEIPSLTNLRESGSIEQDADVVLFLSENNNKGTDQHNAVLSVAKNRNGETGPLRLNWEPSRTLFSCVGSNVQF